MQYKTIRVLLLTCLITLGSFSTNPIRILIFSKTDPDDGFRHDSIEHGIEVLNEIGKGLGYEMEHTENAGMFTDVGLSRFRCIIFLNTSHEVLNDTQQDSFKRFIEAGGGFIGIHGATTTEYDWPWYGKLVGAFFLDHPEIQEAVLEVRDRQHPVLDSIPDLWIRSDEWYNFKEISPDLNVILTIDESSYEGGKNGKDHPIAWYHHYDGGFAFYTALGHTSESYDEPLVRNHLKNMLVYVIREVEKISSSKINTIKK